jgi:hypothetical protein
MNAAYRIRATADSVLIGQLQDPGIHGDSARRYADRFLECALGDSCGSYLFKSINTNDQCRSYYFRYEEDVPDWYADRRKVMIRLDASSGSVVRYEGKTELFFDRSYKPKIPIARARSILSARCRSAGYVPIVCVYRLTKSHMSEDRPWCWKIFHCVREVGSPIEERCRCEMRQVTNIGTEDGSVLFSTLRGLPADER